MARGTWGLPQATSDCLWQWGGLPWNGGEGGGRRQPGALTVIPLVVQRPALDSSLNPSSTTFRLCSMG